MKQLKGGEVAEAKAGATVVADAIRQKQKQQNQQEEATATPAAAATSIAHSETQPAQEDTKSEKMATIRTLVQKVIRLQAKNKKLGGRQTAPRSQSEKAIQGENLDKILKLVAEAKGLKQTQSELNASLSSSK